MLRVRSAYCRMSRPLLLLFLCAVIAVVVTISMILFLRNKSKVNGPTAASGSPEDAVVLLPELMEHMRWDDGENVLDFGCGVGAAGYDLMLPKLRQHNSRQYAVEYVWNNLEKAMKNYSHPSIKYAIGNLLGDHARFPFRHILFDKVFAIYLFHIVPDIDKVLARVKDLMRPGGQLGFITLTENNLAFKMKLQLSKTPEWKQYLHDYQLKYHPIWSRAISQATDGKLAMRKLLERSGFRVVQLKMDRKSFRISSIDNFIDSMFWLTPAFEDVPANKILDLRLEIRKRIANFTGLSPDVRNFVIDKEYILGVVERV